MPELTLALVIMPKVSPVASAFSGTWPTYPGGKGASPPRWRTPEFRSKTLMGKP